ncbi:MAG: type II secretion system protein GspD [Gemmataceae bacterium]
MARRVTEEVLRRTCPEDWLSGATPNRKLRTRLWQRQKAEGEMQKAETIHPSRWLFLPLKIVAAVALGVVLLGQGAPSFAQSFLEPPNPSKRLPRAREIRREANLAWTRGDYQTAYRLFQQARQIDQQRPQLEPYERQDLEKQITQTTIALQGRQQGHDLLLKANEALQGGDRQRANAFLVAASRNQYLSPGDRRLQLKLQQQLQARVPNSNAPERGFRAGPAETIGSPEGSRPENMGPGAYPQEYRRGSEQTEDASATKDYSGLLSAAREAMKRGDYDTAERLANQAKKAYSGVLPSWMPWNSDSPSKVLRDVRAARVQQGPDSSPKETNGGFRPLRSMLAWGKKPNTDNRTELPPPADPSTKYAQGSSPSPNQHRIENTGQVTESRRQGTENRGQGTAPWTGKPSPTATETARDMIRQGYQALLVRDYPTAARLAEKAHALRPRLARGEKTPGDLMRDVHKADRVIRTTFQLREDPTTTKARKLIEQGYEALGQGNAELARKLANEASLLNHNLQWYEKTPENLLTEIETKSPALTTPRVAKETPGPRMGNPGMTQTKPAPTMPKGVTEPRDLLEYARKFFEQGYLDEAEKLCTRAANAPGANWGLFGDNPNKLHGQIQQARNKINREAALKLLDQARGEFQQGNLKEAKRLAWQAQRKHRFSVWDISDRPKTLLAEIAKVEIERKKNNRTVPRVGSEPSRTDTPRIPSPEGKLAGNGLGNNVPGTEPIRKPGKAPTIAERTPSMPGGNNPLPIPGKGDGLKGDGRIKTPIGSEPPGFEKKVIAELKVIRDLQRQGRLAEAREKALAVNRAVIDAGKRGVGSGTWNGHLSSDSPQKVLLDLNMHAKHDIGKLMHDADNAANNSLDPRRFEKAEALLGEARGLAQTFGFDLGPIEERTRHLATLQGKGAAVPPPGEMPNELQMRGKEWIAGSRKLLEAGRVDQARKLAIMAYDEKGDKYGVNAQAAALLRECDNEEAKQFVATANRRAEAAIFAAQQEDYQGFWAIANSIDMKLLTPTRARTLRELLSSTPAVGDGPDVPNPGVGPTKIAQGSPGELPLGPNGDQGPPGRASVGKGNSEDSLLKRQQILEQVRTDKFRQESEETQRLAFKLFSAGERERAITLLQEFDDKLAKAGLGSQQERLLRSSVATRVNQYRTIHQRALWEQARRAERERVRGNTAFDREQDKLKRQLANDKEIRKLIKEANELYNRGRFEEAAVLAWKAKSIDPDNLSANMAIRMANLARNKRDFDDIEREKEAFNLKAWNVRTGPYVGDVQQPIAIDPDRLARARKRKPGEGIPSMLKSAKEHEIEQKLLLPLPALNFQDVPLKSALESLQEFSGVNIVENTRAIEEAGINLSHPVSLRVVNISMKSALNLLLEKARLTYVIKHEVLHITTQEDAAGKVVTVTYPVADLVVAVQDSNGRRMKDLTTLLEEQANRNQGVMTPATPFYPPGSPILPAAEVGSYSDGSGFSSGGGPDGSGRIGPAYAQSPPDSFLKRTIERDLINLITTTGDPDTWSQVGGQGRIQYFPLGMGLVVTQTQDVQEQVADLLRALRKLQDLEVAIEVRLIAVSESFFEYMGLDFDLNFTTNQGRFEPQLLTGGFQPGGVINRFLPDGFTSGLTPAGTFTPDLNIPIESTSFNYTIPTLGGFPGALGANGGLSVGLAFLSDIQVFMFLEAAQGNRRANNTQAPRVTVFNGQTAVIAAQDQVAFLSGVQPSVNAFGNGINFGPQFVVPVPNVIPIGTTINVAPVVSADRRFVRLSLQLQMQNLISANIPIVPIQIPVPQVFIDGSFPGFNPALDQQFLTVPIQLPQLSSIFVQTTVTVPDGGTVLLGGLKALLEERTEYGPPVLSKIPYISRLFKNVGYGRAASSLLMMVTPRIIINEEEEQIFLEEVETIPRL